MNECVFIGMPMLRELFPGRASSTLWRWNGDRGGKFRLPESDLDFGQRDPAWTVDTIIEWADRTGLRKEMDEAALARICGSV